MENEKKQNKGKWLLILAVVSALGAVFTLLPIPMADDKCIFGYYAVCPFTPFSSVILFALSYYLIIIRKKQYISK